MTQFVLKDEAATVACGDALAAVVKNKIKQGIIVYLHGNLGAGKTTFTRGFVRGMGHSGNVKSPTYTLVEPYELGEWNVFHFDLYRLSDPEELEFMGIRDYFNESSSCFIEWPDKGQGMLANPDITINIAYDGEQRIISFDENSILGQQTVAALCEYYST